ncbi:A/G-specific adenine glycosylase [Sandarakinorhabdus cyanobacteriorum]|uniref:Adenine DNA glycosylase n=1 Tax=Sandarakinorhabdus cyanobacteriorum TaxID=1981098 RepID=A0A255Z5E2_9SPHN|nr:A/G-specific adenine glycosylase [Sandarakinorhabdus cyanobacteriorum]
MARVRPRGISGRFSGVDWEGFLAIRLSCHSGAVSDSWPHDLLDWYGAHARVLPWRNPPGAALPDDPDWPYRVWLSEVMLQQTTVEAATPYFHAFTARWPTVAALAACDDDDLMQAWAGLGYYARARNLLACARAVVAQHGGRFPGEEAALRALPGIGDYTAAAVAAFGFGRDAVVIDGNVERVVTRLLALAEPLPGARGAIRAALATAMPAGRAGDFAQGLMDLARRVCTPRAPRCLACPIAATCAGRQTGAPEDFPVKPAKKARPQRQGTAWWIEAEGQVLLVRRPAKGLLGGMLALPSCDWRGQAAVPPLSGDWQAMGVVRHGFTHFELALTVKALRLAARPELDGEWVAVGSAATGLPTLFAKAVQLVLAHARDDGTNAA